MGSTTKVHTAVLVMRLVEEGRIGLDEPVGEQLPGFRLPDAHATRTVTPPAPSRPGT
ncbi:beta-lactamase family protein [Umezawaea endophytica]|uniref:Beta-lactamase family protein n=1 Tax=Umezawaea endophytica TaxID=1654476 RepID=A0A9X2VWW7_9PSEU|nr:beta-lactamase family protein [Umezawaea endophytica]